MAPAAATTVFQAFGQAASRAPERPFLEVLPETAALYGVAAGPLSYGQAAERVAALGEAYGTRGWGPGHRVGLLLQNRPQFLLHWLALNGLGASVVPINPDLRAAELEYMIGHCAMAGAVALPDRAGDLAAAAAAAGRPLGLWGPEAPPPTAPPAGAADPAGPGREAAILYTSGTTGRPKGCVLTNTYFLACGDWYAGMGGACALAEGDRMLTPLPLFHMNAMACSVMAMLQVAGCLILLDRFHPRSWWDSVRAARATIIHYLGVMPAMLMGAPPDAARDRDHRVRFGFGAGVAPELHAPFEARFGFPLIEAWAMTETGAGGVISAHREPRKPGTHCFGRPASTGVQARIVDQDGQDVADDIPGQLLVRHGGTDPRYGFFREYLHDPEATAAAWAGGWFHTGDVVRRDHDGDLHFVDRARNVIRRSGENIAAIEVEGVLNAHPDITQAAVAPVGDAIRGEEVFACLRAAGPLGPRDQLALAQAVVAWCLTRLAYYKAPGWVAFVDQLPLTSTNKIQRAELKALAARLLEAGQAIDLRALKKRGA